MELVRLNKYLAMCGLCSRRDADKIIADGRVLVNGNVAEAGLKVDDGDTVSVDGKEIHPVKEKIVIAYNKPRGVVVTERDEHADITVIDAIDYKERLTYAGRLDKDSEGLLLLSNDGDFINAAMKGINHHEKEYVVVVDKEVSKGHIQNLKEGVYLDELGVKTRPCKVEQMPDAKAKHTYRVTISQGLNRQIRRMFDAFGYKVLELKRIRVINVLLGDIELGKYRELTEAEKISLYKEVGLIYK